MPFGKKAPALVVVEAESMPDGAAFQFLMCKGSFALETAIFCYCFYLTTKLREIEASKGERFFWAQSIMRACIMCYGGGTLVPMALGMRPFPLGNDAALSVLLIAWWLGEANQP